MRLSIAGAILTLGLLSAPLGADAQPAGEVRRVALRRGGMETELVSARATRITSARETGPR